MNASSTARVKSGLAQPAVGLLLVLCSPLLHAASAAERTWNVTSGVWQTGGNWIGGAPAGTDTAYFSGTSVGSGTTISILGSTSQTIAGLTFAGSGTTAITGTTGAARTLVIGTGGLTIQSGAGPVVFGTSALAGTVSGTTVTLQVAGSQTWRNDSAFTFAHYSTLTTPSSGGTNSIITLDGSGNFTFSGAISGAAGRTIGIVKSGSGALTLAQANTFTGGFTLSSGTIVLTSNNTLGAANNVVTIAAGGVIDTGAAAISNTVVTPYSWNGNFSFLGSNTWNMGTGAVTLGADTVAVNVANLTASGSLTVGGAIGDGGAGRRLEKTGSGMLVLNGANSGFSGGTQLTSGTILVGGTASLGTSGSLTFAGGVLRLSTMGAATDYSGRIKGSTAAIAIDTGTVTSVSYSGAIDASNVAGLNKTGTGTLILAGANAYTGTTTFGAGVLVADNASALGNAAGTLTFASGTLSLTGNSGADYSSRIRGSTGAIVIDTGTVSTVTFASGMDGSNVAGLTKTGTGTLVLAGTNAYLGPTAIGQGTLQVGNGGAAGSLGTGTAAVTNSGALVFSRSDSFGTLSGPVSGAGSVTLSGGAITLSGANTFTGGFTLGSSGTVVLSSTNALGGPTSPLVINGGAIDATAGLATAASYAQTWNNGFTFLGTGTLNLGSGAVTLASVPMVTVNVAANSLTVGGAVGDGGGARRLEKAGPGTLILNGANSGFTGGTLLTTGTIQVGGTAALGTSGSLTFAGGVLRLTSAGAATDYASRIRGSTGAIAIDTGTVATATYAGDLDASNVGGLAKSGTGILVLTGSSTYGGSTTISAGSLQIGAAGVLGLLSSGSVANAGTLVFNRTDSYGGPVANAISGAGGVTLSGGTLTLAGNNTYSGTTAVNGGVLVLGGTGAARNSMLNVAAATNVSFASAAGSGGFTVAGLTGSGTVTLQNDTAAAVALTVGGGNASTTFSGRFVGPGSLVKVGSGTLTLSGSSPSFGGGVTLSAGRLGLGTAGAMGSGTFTIAGDGSVSFDNTAGTGATTWSNPQNWNADFAFGGAGVGAVFTGGVTLGGSRTVTVSGVGGQSLQITGTVGDGGAGYGITKEGLGDMTLGAANTYSGTTTIQAGRLMLGNGSAIGTGPLVLSGGTLANSAVLALPNNAQFWNGDFTVSVASSFDLGTGPVTLGGNRTATFNLGSATVGGSIGDGGAGYQLRRAGTTNLTLGGSNSYSGGTVLAGGVTIAANAYALGTTGTIDFEGGTLQYTGTAPLIDISSRIRTSGSTVIVNLGGATVTYASSIDQTNTAGLSALGSGTLVLSASNSYGGGTTLASTSNLTLLLNNDFALSGGAVSGTGAAGALSIDNTSGAARSFANPVSLAGSAASAFNVLGTNPLTFAGTTTILGNATFTVSGTAPLTLARLDSDTGARAFTKAGAGTLVLLGVSPAFASGTGGFTLSGGALVTGQSRNLGSGTFTLGTGTLQMTAAFTGSNAITGPVALSGGTSQLVGPGSVEMSGPVNLVAGKALNLSLGAGESLTLSGAITAGNGSFAFTGTSDTVISGPITATGASQQLYVGLNNASLTLSGSNSFRANTQVTGAAKLNIDDPWALGGYGVSFSNIAAAFDNTSGGPITMAVPTNIGVPSLATFVGTNDLDLFQGRITNVQDVELNVVAGTLTIAAISLPGGVNWYRNFSKSGDGTLVITTGSSLTNGFLINSGTVRLGPDGRIFSGKDAAYSPRVVSGMLDYNGVSQTFNVLNLGGTAVGTTVTSAVVATGTGTLTINGNVTYTAGGSWGLVSGGLLLANDAPVISVAETTANGADLTITADIMSSATTNNVTKSGAGMLALSGSNTYSGTTTVSAGGLRLDSAFALPGGFGATGGTSNLSMSTNTLLGLGTSGTFARGLGSNGDQVKFGANGGFAAFGGDRFVSLGGGGVTTWGAASFVTGTFTLSAAEATGTLNYLNPLDLGATAGTKVVSVPHGSADVDAVMSGVISGSSNFTLGKVGQGTLSLTAASTYSGTTSIRDGVVQITSLAAAGATSPLGTGSLIELGAAATSGTLRYTGSGHASNRGFSLTGNGALDAIGSGAIQFSGGVTGTGAVARTFSLTGTSTAANAFAGTIADGSGTTSLVKSGVGSWTLSGNNSFTGQASVVQGTLVVGHASALGAGPRPLVGGTDAGLGGTASLLLAAGISLGRDLEITAAGSGATQGVVLGGANTTGTSTFGTGIVRVARDVTLQAAGGGVVRFQSNWTGASGSGSLTDRSFTFGSAGNTGTVVVSSSIATSGGMTVAAGILRLADQIVRPGAGLPFTIASAGELAGTGTVAAVLAGSGSVGPGNSPGILLAEGVDPTGGLDFDLEFTDLEPLYSSPTASRNDILRLTGTAPFTADLTAANSVDVYLPAAVAAGQTYQGGFFTDRTAALFPNFSSTVSGGAFAFYVSDPSGTVSYKGNPYSLLPNTLNVIVSTTTVASANFSGGTVTGGQVTTFVVVPEPGALGLAAVGTAAAALKVLRRRCLRHGRHRADCPPLTAEYAFGIAESTRGREPGGGGGGG